MVVVGCVQRKCCQEGSQGARLYQRKVSEVEPPSGDSGLTSTLTQATFSWLREGRGVEGGGEGGRQKVSRWVKINGGSQANSLEGGRLG